MSSWNQQARWHDVLTKNNDEDFSSDDWIAYIDELVYNAYIAGYQNSRRLGLNIPVEDRADEYCKSKGLRV